MEENILKTEFQNKEESILLLLGKVAIDSNIKCLKYGLNNFKFDNELLTNNFEK